MTEKVTLAIVKQLLESQDKAYRATIQLFMEDVRGELKSLRKDLDDVKLSVSFLSKEYDTAKVESKESDSRIHACIDKLTRKINQVEDDTMASVEDMADHASYLENQSRRNNVKIIGVPESSSERTWEDTEKKVKVLIKSELKIEDNIEIERAHRVGKYQSRGRRREDGGYEPPKPRPIVAKISSWKVKESIVKKARAVRPQSIKFVDDFSQRTLAKRNNQIPEKCWRPEKEENWPTLLWTNFLFATNHLVPMALRRRLQSSTLMQILMLLKVQYYCRLQ